MTLAKCLSRFTCRGLLVWGTSLSSLSSACRAPETAPASAAATNHGVWSQPASTSFSAVCRCAAISDEVSWCDVILTTLRWLWFDLIPIYPIVLLRNSAAHSRKY